MTIHGTPAFPRFALEQFFSSAATLSLSARRPNKHTDLRRSDLISAFERLGTRLAEHRQQCAVYRRSNAPGFNVFDFIDPSENVLSDILKFFLDPKESHGQGANFLHLLLARVRPDVQPDCAQAGVVREASTYSIKLHRRRIDILATMPDFMLAIENKKFSGEGREQIQDYCQHLRNIAGQSFCLIFLTRTGAEASSITPALASGIKKARQLLSWSWERDVPAWLAECKAKCKAVKVRHFLEDFTAYIRVYLATTEDLSEDNEDNQDE